MNVPKPLSSILKGGYYNKLTLEELVYPQNKPDSYWPAGERVGLYSINANTNTLYSINEGKSLVIFQKTNDAELELNIDSLKDYEDSDEKEERINTERKQKYRELYLQKMRENRDNKLQREREYREKEENDRVYEILRIKRKEEEEEQARKEKYEQNRERLLRQRLETNDKSIEVPPPYQPPPKKKFKLYVGPSILVKPPLLEETTVRFRMSANESDVLNRRYPVLTPLLFEGDCLNKKQSVKQDSANNVMSRKRELDSDASNAFKYYIHDDPWAEYTEVIVTKVKAKRKAKRLFQLTAQTEVVYLENDQQKFYIPENTTRYKNIYKYVLELTIVKPFYASEGVDLRYVPVVDPLGVKEIEELERKARLEILRKGTQGSESNEDEEEEEDEKTNNESAAGEEPE